MGIVAIVQEALRIARTHKSLWLFGFLVGLGGINVGYDTGGGDQAPDGANGLLEPAVLVPLALIALAGIIGLIILRFLSAGALIEGVKRARRNVAMTVGEGFREGWAHWGVLFRVALLYGAITLVSMALLIGACFLVVRALGSPALYVAIPVTVFIAVPWLVTLHMWQAFAERIAVFENRRALDALRKARLFLHGRLSLGLKLIVAALLGTFFIVAVALLVAGPVALLLFALASFWGALPSIGIGALLALPVGFAFIAMLGLMSSSVWTIGYLTQVEL